MPRYANGQIPESELIIFNRGQTIHWVNGQKVVEDWYQGLTPGTYQKHLALVKRSGGRLQLSAGFSCYRPLYGQRIARLLYGNGAAVVGTSSHGGYWEGRDTMAMDYGNWSAVFGTRQAFYDACRAVGLTPGMISTSRGYPDEPWHVIDFEPWRAVPAGGGAVPFETEPVETEYDMRAIHSPNRPWSLVGSGYFRELNDEEAANTIWPKHELNDRQFDLNRQSALAAVATLPATGGMLVISSPNRPKTLVGPGYYRVLNDEEAANVSALAERVVAGNDRQYDLWVSMALAGQGAATPLNADLARVVTEAVAEQLKGLDLDVDAVDYDKVAQVVREKFRTEPMS